MTRRFAGMVVGSQTLAVFLGALVAWAIAKAQHNDAHTSYIVVGLVLAVLCVVAAGTLRRPWGVTLGWIVDWTRRYQAGDDMRQVSLADIERFMAITPNA